MATLEGIKIGNETYDFPKTDAYLKTESDARYATKTEVSAKASSSYVNTELAKKQDTLTAGEGVTIQNNVISANGIGDLPITKETTTEEQDELVCESDNGDETYVKVGNYGIKAKAYLDIDGNPISGGESIEDITTNGVVINQGVLMSGASFASGVENNWFAILAAKLRANGYSDIKMYDKAFSSSNVMYDAYRLKQGTFFTEYEFENFDVLLLNHVHDKDVFTLRPITIIVGGDEKTYTASQLESFSASQYESEGIIDYFNTNVYDSGTKTERALWLGYRPEEYYAAAYDYIFKKYRQLCFEARNNASSRWYCDDASVSNTEFKFGKPCQIVLMCNWNEGRPTINSSMRKLAKKWSVPFVNLSRELGLSNTLKLDNSTSKSESAYYARDTETLNGIQYGKHMVYSSSAPYPIIQQKIAKILFNKLK